MEWLRMMWKGYERWWNQLSAQDHFHALVVVIATAIGALYRLTNLPYTIQFLADQGRDAIVAYGITHGDFTLVGPSTSVGDMFLGPLYYYFMAPFLLLANFDPIGPAVAVAVLGIITIPILYYIARQLVGKWPAFFATILYATGPFVIEYTRFSWNPNPAPIVMLLLLYAVWRAWKGSAWWWVVVAAAWATIIQLHYVAALAAAPAGIFWIADVCRCFYTSQVSRRRQLLLSSLTSAVVILLSFVPLVAFDIRFDGIISRGFAEFLNGEEVEVQRPFTQTLFRIWREQQGRAMHVLLEIWGNKDWFAGYRTLNIWLLSGMTFVLGLGLIRNWRTPYRAGWLLILAAMYFSILGLAWFDGTVYNHYISFLYPVSYLIIGLVLVELVRWFKWFGLIPAGALLAYIMWMSVQPSSLAYLKPLGLHYARYADISEVILEQVGKDQSYSMANLSEVRDYRGLSYRYFLLTSDHPPVEFASGAQADVLVIVADSPRDPEQVLASPVYEVATFPKGEYRTLEIDDGPVLYFINRGVPAEAESSNP